MKIHTDIIQGSDEWHALRCGILTASEMKLIITPGKMQYAQNDKYRSHLYELLAQRVTQHVEPSYISDAMLRGMDDEITARSMYSEKYAPVTEVGFITNDKWGFALGCSPDGLVGDDGMIEVKSRCQKYQMETIISGKMPDEYMLQVQTALLVSERKWCDFITYCGGMHMMVIRVDADADTQEKIIEAAKNFEEQMKDKMAQYRKRISDSTARLFPTERKIETEMFA